MDWYAIGRYQHVEHCDRLPSYTYYDGTSEYPGVLMKHFDDSESCIQQCTFIADKVCGALPETSNAAT